MKRNPPQPAQWLFTKMNRYEEMYSICRDVEEVFCAILAEKGYAKASIWYWYQCIVSLFRYFSLSTIWSTAMIKNCFKTSIRSLKRQKIHSFIEISGLAIGMAVCMLLMLFIQDELGFDRFHKNADHIYRLINKYRNSSVNHPFFAPQVSRLLLDNFPEVKEANRILHRDGYMVQYKNDRFREDNFIYADNSFFSIFSFKLKSGNPKTVLLQPFSIVLTERMAQKYFGKNDPMGEVLRVENEHDYTVTGVMYDVPGNSHFTCNFVATLAGADAVFGKEWMQNWGWQNFFVYARFQDEFSQSDFEAKYTALFTQFMNTNEKNAPHITLQNLKDIHLHSAYLDGDIRPQGDITYVYIFSGIGILILIIACFNYIYLLTANVTTRAVEVGIKKVAGASKQQLAWQFFSESVIIIVFALAVSVFIVSLLLPLFNSLTGKSLAFSSLLNKAMIGGIITMAVLTGIVAGSYPALYLASIKPVSIFKGIFAGGKSKRSFNRFLVVIQFSITGILIISAAFMFRQLHYIQNRKLGFDKEHIVILQNHEPENREKFEQFKHSLLENSRIISVAAGDRVPSGSLNNVCGFKHEGHDKSKTMSIVHISYDYFKTIGITRALKGRFFSHQLESDAKDAVILNESAVKHLELTDAPLGKSIFLTWPPSNRNVVGIVKDFHFESLYENIQPVAFIIHYPECWKIMVKVNPVNLEGSLAEIEKTWKAFYPDWVYEFSFMDTRFDQIYSAEKRTFQLMGYFSFLAIVIACFGLFGLASFTTKRRFKEIGVRKVLGSSVMQIIALLSRDFLKWVFLANVIAVPAAWFAVDRWFSHFAYHTQISWWVFALSAAGTSIIALLAVSWQSFSAATHDPVDSLKYE